MEIYKYKKTDVGDYRIVVDIVDVALVVTYRLSGGTGPGRIVLVAVHQADGLYGLPTGPDISGIISQACADAIRGDILEALEATENSGA